MMRIALQVKYVDGREQAVMLSAPDLIAFERQFDKPMRAITTGRMEYLWWTTWHSAKRRGLTSDDFEAWIETVDVIGDDPNASADIVPLETTQATG